MVLLVHEGAPTTDCVVERRTRTSDMGRIVNGADENIDAIVSGHTHLAYNHAIPGAGWIDEGRAVTTRPVVSAGQYGYNLNQLVFKLDASEGCRPEQKIQPLVTANPGPPVTYTANYPADPRRGDRRGRGCRLRRPGCGQSWASSAVRSTGRSWPTARRRTGVASRRWATWWPRCSGGRPRLRSRARRRSRS